MRIARLEQIAAVLFKHELYSVVENLGLKTHLPLRKKIHVRKKFFSKEIQAPILRAVFEELGGAFLKLGQMLAMRPDLVGSSFSKEFSVFLDHVPPEKFEDIRKIVDEKIGMHNFSEFDSKPIAAGSIAQVHHAILNGNNVAVKVRRPNVAAQFKIDIELMEDFALKLKNRYNWEFIDPVEIIDEFKKYTSKELDFTHEASNMMRFKENFKGYNSIIIPKVYTNYSSSDVLVMQLLDGVILADNPKLSKDSRHHIVRTVFEMSFKQLFEDGFFHADLHSGNMLLMKDNRIGLLDFGITGYIDNDLKEKITSLFVALINGDLEKTANALIDMNTNAISPDRNALKEGLYYTLADYYDSSLEKMDFSKIFSNAIDTARKSRIKLPAQLVLFGKSIITMEGFCCSLDPNFDFVKESRPYVKKLMFRNLRPKKIISETATSVLAMRQLIINFPQYVKDVSSQIRIMEHSMSELDERFGNFQSQLSRMTKTLVYGIIASALIVSSALLIDLEPKVFNISIYSAIGYCISIILFISIWVNFKKKYY